MPQRHKPLRGGGQGFSFLTRGPREPAFVPVTGQAGRQQQPAMPKRPPPQPPSDTETSWPSEDPQDHTAMVQTERRVERTPKDQQQQQPPNEDEGSRGGDERREPSQQGQNRATCPNGSTPNATSQEGGAPQCHGMSLHWHGWSGEKTAACRGAAPTGPANSMPGTNQQMAEGKREGEQEDRALSRRREAKRPALLRSETEETLAAWAQATGRPQQRQIRTESGWHRGRRGRREARQPHKPRQQQNTYREHYN